uniref:C-type lectin domain family 2, member h n=1 Tax=Mus musculus TaxID=10090 RepID=A0A0N4SW92_MOUSE
MNAAKVETSSMGMLQRADLTAADCLQEGEMGQQCPSACLQQM